jgi:catechol 2,3-dioxygenase-like lactoylglutathione lyase family enzyme
VQYDTRMLKPPAHRGLRHLALNVRRLAEMKAFYVDLLGFRIEWEPDPDNVYLTSGVDNLALHRAPGSGGGTESGSGSLDHLGLIVAAAADVDAWAAFLEGNGVTLAMRPKTHRDGARSCYVTDPDGNRVQIIHHPPISGTI